MRLLSALALLPLAACAAIPGRAPSSIPTDWRSVAAGNDRERLSEWRQAFTEALDKARKGGHGADIDREGALSTGLSGDTVLEDSATLIMLGSPEQRRAFRDRFEIVK